MRRSHWAWGYQERFPTDEERAAIASRVAFVIGDAPPPAPLPREEDATLPSPRLVARPLLSTDRGERLRHTYGRSYEDLVRGFRGDFSSAPCAIAFPKNEEEIQATFDLAKKEGAVIVPLGGGTSVVRGTEHHDPKRPTISLDLRCFDHAIDFDRTSRLARLQAGMTGPMVEDALRPHGVSLRHFPQSFELSTLGGWIVTRAGGHFATLYTHIDDLTCAVRMVTPSGVWETRRVPASGAGPDPNRMVLGSEGILGIVTEATMRVVPRPTHRARASVTFGSMERAIDACRAVAQSGLHPANCRLLDPVEAMMNGVAMDGSSVLVIAFESADHEVRASMERALVICARRGGTCEQKKDDPGEKWRSAFLRAPYLQSALVTLGVVADTFETACTWDRFAALDADIRASLASTGPCHVAMRFTHVYPDGPAPYYTFVARTEKGAELDRWRALKHAASEAIVRQGATITHHHAVGRMHRPYYDRERPEPFAKALIAAKQAVDPSGLLNPGVLV